MDKSVVDDCWGNAPQIEEAALRIDEINQ